MVNNIPETKDDWWNLAEKYKKELKSICYRFAYSVKDSIIIDKYIQEKNRNLARVLSEAWDKAPDNSSLHQIPGWNILCNLLSEEYVLDKQEEN